MRIQHSIVQKIRNSFRSPRQNSGFEKLKEIYDRRNKEQGDRGKIYKKIE